MQNQESYNQQSTWKITTIVTIAFLLFSCQSSGGVPVSAGTAVPATATIIPVTVTPTAILTPPVLPANFETTQLNPLDTPHTYIEDTCQYLKNKWNPSNAKPGTVVMVILVKGIYK